MKAPKHPIETLRATRWWLPTVRRYAAHLTAIKRLGCPDIRERFIVFATEVLLTPEALRDDLLRVDTPPAQEPETRYRQYESPKE